MHLPPIQLPLETGLVVAVAGLLLQQPTELTMAQEVVTAYV